MRTSLYMPWVLLSTRSKCWRCSMPPTIAARQRSLGETFQMNGGWMGAESSRSIITSIVSASTGSIALERTLSSCFSSGTTRKPRLPRESSKTLPWKSMRRPILRQQIYFRTSIHEKGGLSFQKKHKVYYTLTVVIKMKDLWMKIIYPSLNSS